jgi:hypothetical protein
LATANALQWTIMKGVEAMDNIWLIVNIGHRGRVRYIKRTNTRLFLQFFIGMARVLSSVASGSPVISGSTWRRFQRMAELRQAGI